MVEDGRVFFLVFLVGGGVVEMEKNCGDPVERKRDYLCYEDNGGYLSTDTPNDFILQPVI